jgi:hypothetical protein
MPDQVRHDAREAKPMLMSNKSREARLHYMPGTFRILTPGDHVRCAATGQPIALDELRYWSVARQEAYSSAELSLKAERRQER